MTEPLPDRLGDYSVIRRIGSGNMGEVFLVKKEAEGDFVTYRALKRLHGNMASDPDFVRALFREARIGGLLAHPNLVQTHEPIRVGQTYAVVMEYIDGADIAEVIRAYKYAGRDIPPRTALELLAQVADGLHYAHDLRDPEGRQLRLIHRDLKPGNIRISRAGAVKVLDFGIARAAGGTSQTQAGALKGTVRYMAPEQARGELDLGPATDIYALGAVLFELLTLVQLHPHSGMHECLGAIIYGDIEPRLALAPEPTRDILRSALAREPGDRPASARDFADEARKLMSQYPSGQPLTRQLEDMVGVVDLASSTDTGADSSGGRITLKPSRPATDTEIGPATGSDGLSPTLQLDATMAVPDGTDAGSGEGTTPAQLVAAPTESTEDDRETLDDEDDLLLGTSEMVEPPKIDVGEATVLSMPAGAPAVSDVAVARTGEDGLSPPPPPMVPQDEETPEHGAGDADLSLAGATKPKPVAVPPSADTTGRSKRPLLVAAIVIGAVVVVGGGAYLAASMMKDSGSNLAIPDVEDLLDGQADTLDVGAGEEPPATAEASQDAPQPEQLARSEATPPETAPTIEQVTPVTEEPTPSPPEEPVEDSAVEAETDAAADIAETVVEVVEATPSAPVEITHGGTRRLLRGESLDFSCSTPGHSTCSVQAHWRKAGGSWQRTTLSRSGERHAGSLKVTADHAPQLEYYLTTSGCGDARWPAGGRATTVKVY